MATNTYVALDSKTVGTAVSSVTFTSIPSGYTDLVLVVSQIATTTGNTIRMTFNGDTATNYSKTYVGGYTGGATYGSTRSTNSNYIYNLWQVGAADTTSPTTVIYDLMNYSNTTTYKTVLFRSNTVASSQSEVAAEVGLWRNTAAISSITLTSSATTFAAGSTFTLYGVAAVPALAAKATGGTIYYGADGYVYHKFTGNGTFTPTQSLTTDVLVVAGGGGGGSTYGQSAGGGAGGLLYLASQALPVSAYSVTVGAAGTFNSDMNGANGTNGGNSSFNTLGTAVGGGGGGSYRNNGQPSTIGNPGGSGGGGGANSSSSGGAGGAGGSGTAGQGNNGGSGYGYSSWGGGGGGGAGGVGTNAVGSSTGGYYLGGNGGIGSSAYSTWGAITGSGENVSGTYYFAGGGGGDESGVNGYGNGSANTGGGGHRTAQSGIVIVRYLG